MRVAFVILSLVAALTAPAVVAGPLGEQPDVVTQRLHPARNDDLSRMPCVRIGSLPTCFPLPPAAVPARFGATGAAGVDAVTLTRFGSSSLSGDGVDA